MCTRMMYCNQIAQVVPCIYINLNIIGTTLNSGKKRSHQNTYIPSVKYGRIHTLPEIYMVASKDKFNTFWSKCRFKLLYIFLVYFPRKRHSFLPAVRVQYTNKS